jgi:hypothetical protein
VTDKCPNCGYCPTCGRSNTPPQGYYPQPYPSWPYWGPYYYGPFTVTASSDTSSAAPQNINYASADTYVN